MNFLHRRLCSSPDWQRSVAERMPGALDGFDLGDAVLEIGPGYGATTAALLDSGVTGLTALEIDEASVRRLRDRFGDRAEIVSGDGARMPFDDGTFSAVVCFTMLHHIPTAAQQDHLFAEAARVLRPGGLFRGVDSQTSFGFRLLHIGDTMNVLDAATLAARLERAGLTEVSVDHTPKEQVRFAARRAG
jgi:ubiquinone/menaquinone biosynthesis C-methylase UbiE